MLRIDFTLKEFPLFKGQLDFLYRGSVSYEQDTYQRFLLNSYLNILSWASHLLVDNLARSLMLRGIFETKDLKFIFGFLKIRGMRAKYQ